MSKHNEHTLVPKLRFPEFVGDEWNLTNLGKIYRFITTNSFSRDDLNYVNGKVKNIHYGDIHTKYATLFDLSKEIVPFINESIPLNKFKDENYCKEGDMIFADASEDLKDIGKSIEVVNLNNEKLLPGLHTLLARQIRPEIVIGFGGYLFSNDGIRRQIQRESQGAKVLGISATRLSNINIFFPKELPEQQKIAACLSSLDALISAESQKLELLKTHTKGLLQNLFPQAGESVPRLRFEEFVGSGDWEEKLIEEYFTVGSSKRVLQEDWTSYGIPFFRTRELVSLSKDEAFKSEVFISEALYKELADSYGVPTEGDFLVSGVGTLGISYQVQTIDKFYFKDGNVIWFKLGNGLHSTYFKYCFQSDHIQNQIINQTSKSTVGTYTIQNAKKTKFWYPPTIKEQQKIASCLSAVDDLISAQGKKLAALKRHKQGLLQGLFPLSEL
ncbi:MAG: restriction endonuclease subunit S [Saprospiraceae bacterium]|nr:restriction endonuclease subunit S [Saprospiraceae bacterium]